MILSVMSYESKNSIFYKNNLKPTKNNTFNNVLCYQIFPYYFFENDWISINHGLFIRKNIFYNSTIYNFENK